MKRPTDDEFLAAVTADMNGTLAENNANIFRTRKAALDEAKRARASEGDGLAAARAALAWLWDPDADATESWERIAAEFYKDTGYLRPGKDYPPGGEPDVKEQNEAWENWRTAKQRQVLEKLRAFVDKAEGKS